MYTDRVDATEEELNERIPLSIARWHQHINFCKTPKVQKAAYFGPDAKFGLRGSIKSRETCEAADGEFFPHVFGWMVHVYSYETDPQKNWSIDDDDQGHDNMDHSAMPGMTCNRRGLALLASSMRHARPRRKRVGSLRPKTRGPPGVV